MDIDRSSIADNRQQDLRARTADVQELVTRPAGIEAAPLAPAHGGTVGSSRAENGRKRSEDEPQRERRRTAMAAIVGSLGLPVGTELDIEVDLDAQEQVSFLIRDRETGELLRKIPEGEAQSLFERLREFHGALIDRAL